MCKNSYRNRMDSERDKQIIIKLLFLFFFILCYLKAYAYDL